MRFHSFACIAPKEVFKMKDALNNFIFVCFIFLSKQLLNFHLLIKDVKNCMILAAYTRLANLGTTFKFLTKNLRCFTRYLVKP